MSNSLDPLETVDYEQNQYGARGVTTIHIFESPRILLASFDFNIPLVTCCGTKAIAVEMRQRKAAMVFMVTSNSMQRVRTAVDTCVSDD